MGSYVSTPNAGQSLGGTRDQMRTNTDLLKASLAINHVDLGSANVGKHKWVEMPVQGSTPATLAGEGTLFTRTFSGASQLCYTPDATTNVYQMTRTITASTALFSTNTNYTGTQSGGWTFLPGGMLLQYGSKASPSSSGSITFPVAFTNSPYSVQLTPRNDGTHSAFTYYLDGAPTSSGFNYRATTSGSNTLFWIAIGV